LKISIQPYTAMMRLAWGRRTVRERVLLSGCAAVFAAMLILQCLWLPARDRSAALIQQIPQLQQQLAVMQEQARTAAYLAPRVHSPAPHGAALQAALQDSLAAQGWMGATVIVQGQSVHLSIPRTSFSSWSAGLLTVQRLDKIHLDTARISALEPAGQVTVEAVFSSQP